MEAAVEATEPRRGRWFVAAVLTIGLVALSAAIVNIATQKAGPSVIRLSGIDDAQEIFGGVPQAGERLGSSDAPVSVQVFNDVQCKGCDQQFLATVPSLVNDYVRSGDAVLDYRNYSFSERAIQEGFIADEAAGEQGYLWQFVYLLFRNQAQAERFGVTDNLLESIANSIGELDVPQWKQDFAAGWGRERHDHQAPRGPGRDRSRAGASGRALGDRQRPWGHGDPPGLTHPESDREGDRLGLLR